MADPRQSRKQHPGVMRLPGRQTGFPSSDVYIANPLGLGIFFAGGGYSALPSAT